MDFSVDSIKSLGFNYLQPGAHLERNSVAATLMVFERAQQCSAPLGAEMTALWGLAGNCWC